MSKTTTLGELDIDSGFKVGMFIEAEYLNPTVSGRIWFNLTQDSKNIPLHFNPRFDWKTLILNTMEEGSWGKEEKPSGYDFTPEIKTKVTIYANKDNFNILINDKYFYEYKYRTLNATTVKKFQFVWEGDSAASFKLLHLRIGYPTLPIYS